jgi:hypothetical protein
MLTQRERRIKRYAKILLHAVNTHDIYGSDPGFPDGELSLNELRDVLTALTRKNAQRLPAVNNLFWKFVEPRLVADPIKKCGFEIAFEAKRHGSGEFSWAETAAAMILRLIEFDAAHRIRRCEICKEWIFVRNTRGAGDERVCSKHERGADLGYKRLQVLYQRHKRKFGEKFCGTEFFKKGICLHFRERKRCDICRETMMESTPVRTAAANSGLAGKTRKANADGARRTRKR